MKKLIVGIILFSVTAFLFAHPGRTDKNGGHNGPNGYHYHNSGSGSSSPSITVAPAPVIPVEKLFILADESEKLYHKELCKTIEGKRVSEISRNTAVNSGYKACDVCKP